MNRRVFRGSFNEQERRLFREGLHARLYQHLGAHPRSEQGQRGVRFTVWAPRARRVSVVGDFNGWNGRAHPLRRGPQSGLWSLFVPGPAVGALYKYEIRGVDGRVRLKADPFAFAAEAPPATASAVWDHRRYRWRDAAWLARRARHQALDRPLSIYEVHAGSWRRGPDGRWLTYRELAATLIPYVRDLGFTHLELLPVCEHPFTGSWGYQTSAYYAPTARFGTPDDFKFFVDCCHRAGLGVLLDWVPAHFPKDAFALSRFDGAALFEHPDPRRGHHPDWDTHCFDYERPEVCSFLLSNAVFWAAVYHIDGLRVDAVASMLYLNYSRAEGAWLPNATGGVENHAAAAFLQNVNDRVQTLFPGLLTFAEESTAWPRVSGRVEEGGLGFSYKWNMGWMNDTLRFVAHPPAARGSQLDLATFSLHYAFQERFILPLSHDEVVHGKGTLLHKAPGPPAERAHGLRALYAWMYAHPGKPLLFMGSELATEQEWQHDGALDWSLLQHPLHAGVQRLVKDLNRLLRATPALYERDHEPEGFEWIPVFDREQGVLAFMRHARRRHPPLLAVFHFGRRRLPFFRLGVACRGSYRVVFNSRSVHYGGDDQGPPPLLHTERRACHGHPVSLEFHLPPLCALYLAPVPSGSG